MRLVDKFDPAHGARFQAFASLWLSSRLSYAVCEAQLFCYLPRYQLERLRQLRRLWDQAEDATYQQFERQPTHLEIAAPVAAQMSLPLRTVADLRFISMPAEDWESIHEEWDVAMDDEALGNSSSRKNGTIPLFVNDPWARQDAAVNLVRRDQLKFVLNKLTPRERDVVWMRFGLEDGYEYTLEEVGQRLAVTRERVRQIELRALKKLRRMGPVDKKVGATKEVSSAVSAEQSAICQEVESSEDTSFSIDDDSDSAI